MLTDKLGRVRHFEAPRMRFHAHVPSDGRKQMNFSGSARPIIQKQEDEWLALEVIRSVKQ